MSLFDDPSVGTIPEPTFSVTELADAIGNALRAASATRSGCGARSATSSRPSPGHVYFTLTDPEGGALARRDAVRRARRASVNPTLTDAGGGVRMTDGTDVRIRGRLDWYAPRGQLQLRMTAIDPAYTLGQLEVARAELLAPAGGRGPARRQRRAAAAARPAPGRARHQRGLAAEADFLDELRRSGFAFQVLRVDTRVQGSTRPGRSRRRIRMLATHRLDVLALVRGGGARTDLAAFDDEAVARAIAACPVPVLTGIGHEVDTSVADEVAHTSAKTPTACAQLLVARVRALAGAPRRRLGRHRQPGVRAVRRHDERLLAPGPTPVARRPRGPRRQRARLDGDRRPVAPGVARGLDAAGRRLDGHRGRITGAARSHLRAAEVLRRPPASAGSPTAPRGRWPRPSGRSARSTRGCGPSTPSARWPAAGRSRAGPDGEVLRGPGRRVRPATRSPPCSPVASVRSTVVDDA